MNGPETGPQHGDDAAATAATPMPTRTHISAQRIGVLSFAHYHANFWSEVFAARRALAGIWDDDADRGREAASRFGVEYFDDLDTLLARCTAAAVCSETVAHPELIERAAKRGLAVLCEKPLGVSIDACERIARTVDATGITFMQSFPKRFDPVSHFLRETVRSGELGTITLVRIRHGHFYGLQDDFKDRWYVDPAKSGGGALLDEGVHAADLLAWLFGMPDSVTAMTSSAALGLRVEDVGIATFTYRNGMLAELTSSFTFAAADASIELYGTKGTVLVSGIDLASKDITRDAFVRRYRTDDPERKWETVALTPRFKLGEFHQQNALAFLHALENGERPPIGVDDGVRAVKMIMAAYEAAATGRRIALIGSPPIASQAQLEPGSTKSVVRTRFRFEGADIPVYVARPAAPPKLTVLMFGAIWSITPHIEDLCNQLAAHGYGAVAPCLFRGTNIPSRDASAEMLAQTFLDFDDSRCIRDLRAALHETRNEAFGFAPGGIVPLGFCLGGRFAHYIAALDRQFAGVVNFYGRLRFARQPNKPFLPAEVTGLIEAPYLGHFAEFDPMIPLEDVEELRAALASRGVANDIRIYEGARHGFVDPERPTEHNPEAAKQAWAATLDFLDSLSRR